MKTISRLLAVTAFTIIVVAVSASAETANLLKNDDLVQAYSETNVSVQKSDNEKRANNPSSTSVTGGVSNVTAMSATLHGYANNVVLGEKNYAGICYSSTNVNPNIDDITITTTSLNQNNEYMVSIRNLEPGKTYYYRAYVYRGGLTQYAASVYSFTTPSIVVTGTASGMTASTAIVSGSFNILSTAYSNIESGVCYSSANTMPTTSDSRVATLGTGNGYSVSLTNLDNNTRYYYRAYVILDGRTEYGEARSFVTSHVATREDIAVTGKIANSFENQEHIVTCVANIGNLDFSNITLGVCWSSTNNDPTTDDFTASTQQMDADNRYKVTLAGWNDMSSCYYRAFVKSDFETYYGEVKSYVAGNSDYVNLGLPSGTLWAACNVGANRPEEYGDYFSWGETAPKKKYAWSTYNYCKGSYSALIKYCNDIDYGNKKFIDSKNVLDASDDVAHIKCGREWHIPTIAEQKELLDPNYCVWIWYDNGNTEFNGVAGYKVQSKMDGYTDNFIFLPAAGSRDATNYDGVGANCSYWSSSLYEDYSAGAWGFYLEPTECSVRGISRYIGLPVRPVCH